MRGVILLPVLALACSYDYNELSGNGSGGKAGSGGTSAGAGGLDSTGGAGGQAGVALPAQIASPRLVGPLSMATVTSQRPTLHWVLSDGTDGAHVEICRDRACTTQVMSIDAPGMGVVPSENLPVGVLFWRAYGLKGSATGQTPSATWQFIVGARSAPVDTSWGATLDVNGDGYADVIVGALDADGVNGKANCTLEAQQACQCLR